MISLHVNHRTPESLVMKRLAPYTKSCLQSASQLMSCEKHYSGGRAQMSQDFQNQLNDGPYLLDTKEMVIYDSLEQTRKKVYISKFQYDAQGNPRRKVSSIKEFGITVVDAQPTDIEYDNKIKTRIAKIIEASTKAITSRSDMVTAQQNALTAEAKGKEKLVEIEYEQKQIQTKLVVEAETKVKTAEQDKLEQKIKAEGAEYEARKVKILADAEAYAKQKIMVADGALKQKLETYITVQGFWADAFGKYQGNIVPLYNSGGTSGGTGNAMQEFMQMQNVKAMKDLNLNLGTK
jgi:hypothetical protein